MASTSTNSTPLDDPSAAATGSSSASMYAVEPLPSSSYRPSPSPSATSQSDDPDREDDDEEEEDDDDDYTDVASSAFGLKDRRNTLKARGSAALVPKINTSETWTMTPASAKNASAATLPHEILLHIFKYVAINPPDLRRSLSVCKSWCLCGVELLWHRPSFPKIASLFKLIHIIRRPDQTFPYASFIRRLNLSQLSNDLEDSLFGRMAACTRLERLTLTGCTQITDDTITNVLQNTKHLVAADFSEVVQLTDKSVMTIAQNCPRLQGINLTGCKNITSASIAALAKNCKLLRRVKLCECDLIGDEALTALAENCPVLLEVDLIKCPLISDASVRKIWQFSFHMRELRLAQCGKLTDLAFPAPASILQGVSANNAIVSSLQQSNSGAVRGSDSAPTSRGASPSGTMSAATGRALTFSSSQENLNSLDTPMYTHLRPSRMFDHLRILDLTNCSTISDTSIEGIVSNVPRIRNLILAKCTRLTNESAYSIARLGKNLHYLHLGHVSNLNDRAVCHLARSCTRLRYIDLACCPQLTDLSVLELAANLPKLRRIGLVRVSQLTDQAMYGLVERHTSLERIHLSYCENISVGAIYWLLERLNRLTHLSLTGVPAFRRQELQSFCRDPPREFNAHQRAAFCVYSGKGVNELRKFLQNASQDAEIASRVGILSDVQDVQNRRNEQRDRRPTRYHHQQMAPPDTLFPLQPQSRHAQAVSTRQFGINLDQAMAAQEQQPTFRVHSSIFEPRQSIPTSSAMEHEDGNADGAMRLPPLNAFSSSSDYQRDFGRSYHAPGTQSHDAVFERMDEDGERSDDVDTDDAVRRGHNDTHGAVNVHTPLAMQGMTTTSGGGFGFRSRGSAPPSTGMEEYATRGAGQTLGAAPSTSFARFEPNTNMTTPTSVHPPSHSLAAYATPPLSSTGSSAQAGTASDMFGRFDPGQMTPIATVDPFAALPHPASHLHQQQQQQHQQQNSSEHDPRRS